MLAELRPYSAHAPRFELFAGPDQALLLAERATPYRPYIVVLDVPKARFRPIINPRS